MHELNKGPHGGSWAGNWVWDENVKESQKNADSGHNYALVAGYPGVMYRRTQPNILLYGFSKGSSRNGQARYFSCVAPYVMHPGDKL